MGKLFRWENRNSFCTIWIFAETQFLIFSSSFQKNWVSAKIHIVQNELQFSTGKLFPWYFHRMAVHLDVSRGVAG
jgi:hypothetical protein